MVIGILKRPKQSLASSQPFWPLIGPNRLISVFSIIGCNVSVARGRFCNCLLKGGNLGLRRLRKRAAQKQGPGT